MHSITNIAVNAAMSVVSSWFCVEFCEALGEGDVSADRLVVGICVGDGMVMFWIVTGVMSGYLSIAVGLVRIRYGVLLIPVSPICVAFGYLAA